MSKPIFSRMSRNVSQLNASVSTSEEDEISVVCAPDKKHQITPQRLKSKINKSEQGHDVHTELTSPVTPSRLSRRMRNAFSPKGFISCSQDNRPDVVWDYTSPKVAKGTRRKDITVTVDEFLKSMYSQLPECTSQDSHYTKILEKWMTTKNATVNKKDADIRNKEVKKISPRVIGAMKQFLDSIQEKKIEAAAGPSTMNPDIPEHFDQRAFVCGNEDASSDESWDEVDYNFFVKATQELESTLLSASDHKLNAEVVSTIPETACPKPHSSYDYDNDPNCQICDDELDFNVDDLTEADFPEDKCTLSELVKYSYFLDIKRERENVKQAESSAKNTQPALKVDPENKENCNGEPDYSELVKDIEFCDSDWDDFFCDDASMNLIPDDVLSGAAVGKTFPKKVPVTEQLNECEFICKNNSSASSVVNQNAGEIPKSEDIHLAKVLFDANEENCFDDETAFCQPEVLSLIDEVENRLSQNRTCTPEEIKRKKLEAMRRRRRKL